jgi:DNA adenine methylase
LIDPFVGGGAVLLAAPVDVPAWGNDLCPEMIGIYERAARGDAEFRSCLDGLGEAWHRLSTLQGLYADLAAAYIGDRPISPALAITRNRASMAVAVEPGGAELLRLTDARLTGDLAAKFDRMKRVEAKVGLRLNERDLLANIEGAVRATFYYAVRARYNAARAAGRLEPQRLADFFFLRELAYAAMFRFNADGAFNVPYGGLTYNRKSFASKADALYSPGMLARLRATHWRSVDFEAFLHEAQPSTADFVFVDPPYDSDFSRYDDRPFGALDQKRLCDTLKDLTSNVMVVIKDTPLIRQLYGGSRWRIAEARKTYMWTIKSRNDRSTSHLVITNY